MFDAPSIPKNRISNEPGNEREERTWIRHIPRAVARAHVKTQNVYYSRTSVRPLGGGTNGHHRPFRDRCICRRGTKTIEFRIRLKRTGIASPSGIPITHDGQRYIQFTGWESGIRTSYVFALLRRPVANPSLDWEAVACEKKGRIQCPENYDIVHDTSPPPREQIAFEVALFYVCLVTWVCVGVVILPGGNTLAVRLDRDRLPR